MQAALSRPQKNKRLILQFPTVTLSLTRLWLSIQFNDCEDDWWKLKTSRSPASNRQSSTHYSRNTPQNFLDEQIIFSFEVDKTTVDITGILQILVCSATVTTSREYRLFFSTRWCSLCVKRYSSFNHKFMERLPLARAFQVAQSKSTLRYYRLPRSVAT